MAAIHVGTCSWADESFVKAWYPPGIRSGEARLRYYADHFEVVEANSTYYRMPDEATVARWAERLPEGFVMHVKAFGMMTRHPVKADVLPADILEAVEIDERGRVDRPSRDVRAEVFRRFLAALEPLRSAGKLGGILMQFPPYIVAKESSYDYLEWAKAQLPGEEMLVEFRHKSWFADPAEPLAFLEGHQMTYVTVDAPPAVIPLVIARTSDTAYVRFHGRNEATWYKRTGSAADRFDYFYSEQELADWSQALRELAAGGATRVYAMFNNNGRSLPAAAPTNLLGEATGPKVAQAPTNAQMLLRLLAT